MRVPYLLVLWDTFIYVLFQTLETQQKELLQGEVLAWIRDQEKNI